MSRSLGFPGLNLLVALAAALPATSFAAPMPQRVPVEIASEAEEIDAVGVVGGELLPSPAKVTNDTVWIADWNFDAGGGLCTDTGWIHYDNRILNDGSNFWAVDSTFHGVGPIVGRAAVLSNRDDPCRECLGYGGNWDQSVVLRYRGTGSTLSFVFLSDSEPGFDFVTVEADSACASDSRVDYYVNPRAHPSDYRQVLLTFDGYHPAGSVSGLILPDFGAPGVEHCALIRFTSGDPYECELYPTYFDAGLVVDGVVVTGGLAYVEHFEGALDPHLQLRNTAPSTPFGEWSRLYSHLTDNDKCTENTTCGWAWVDSTLLGWDPSTWWGPGGALVRNWLDNILVGPWVPMTPMPYSPATVLSFRRFPGNRFANSKIVQGWRVRSKVRVDNTETPAPGDSFDCVTPWGHASSWNSLSTFAWITSIFDMTWYVQPTAREIQLSFRVSDWQLIAGEAPPVTFIPHPGPYLDRVRIGRRVLAGPAINEGIDRRFQAQDCFPTYRNSILPGEHYSPSTDRFGTCAFSMSGDIVTRAGPNLVTGDSIRLLSVTDARGAGGVTAVRWYGAIVEGAHAGKAPAPYTVGSNGFFQVSADSCRQWNGTPIWGCFFVDLDDTYFRGGDVLLYFWTAQDAAGGFSSFPVGLAGLPGSVAEAEAATHGLLEVSFLPAIDWDPAYLARIAADPHGDLDPTPEEIAASRQRNCILYYQKHNSARRSGSPQRSSFMYTLDRLGYEGAYDVYDVQGYGNTNNQLGGRATIQQATGYALLVEDDGRSSLTPNVPDGSNWDNEKVNQCQWYRDWLAQGSTGLAGRATLWILGENTAYEKPTNPLFAVDMGLASVVTDQALSANPEVRGVASFTFEDGCSADFSPDLFALQGGCPSIRMYDGYTTGGTAPVTHRYASGAVQGPGAVAMNANAAQSWNTVMMGFAWSDVRDGGGGSPGTPELALAARILGCALADSCQREPEPTGVPPDEHVAAPAATVLHQPVPNPFNPATAVAFDLARAGRVWIAVYDAAGRRVRVLLDEFRTAGWRQEVTWNGVDDAGRRVSSGVYFLRMTSGEFAATRRLVVLK